MFVHFSYVLLVSNTRLLLFSSVHQFLTIPNPPSLSNNYVTLHFLLLGRCVFTSFPVRFVSIDGIRVLQNIKLPSISFRYISFLALVPGISGLDVDSVYMVTCRIPSYPNNRCSSVSPE